MKKIVYMTILALSLSANAKQAEMGLPGIGPEIGIVYLDKGNNKISEKESLRKVNEILKNHYLSKQKIEEEKNEVLKKYFIASAQMYANGNVIASKFMIEESSKIDGFKQSEVGNRLSQLYTGAIYFTEDDLGEEADSDMKSVLLMRNVILGKYKQALKGKAEQIRMVDYVILGAIYDDLTAEKIGFAMLTNLGEVKLIDELKMDTVSIKKKMALLRKQA